ncbi:MAG: hypothetical protein R2830_05150 [Saprospiraceae bacterium]
MKYFNALLFLTIISLPAFGQTETQWEKGTVSYVSSQNVYVKFKSTAGVNIGDTLFVKKEEAFIPSLVVSNKSSTSIVSSPIVPEKFAAKDEVFVRTIVTQKEEKAKKTAEKDDDKKQVEKPTAKPLVTVDEDNIGGDAVESGKPDFKQKIGGRISAASYSTFSDRNTSHRMRYAFNLNGNNINNSRFSTESYITFRHTFGEWQEVQDNLADALKVYTLDVKYDLDKRSSVTLGRRINNKIASMGAIDGLQVEKGLGREFLLGAIAGTRPDYSDYSFNTNLLQVGAYIGHVSASGKKYQQSTLAIVEQRNHANTDRRFVYFQHSNTLVDNLNLFSSLEMDLFENINNEAHSKLSLTNMYLSLRYRFSKKFNASLSYDNRKNIIFYESYKNFIDQLIDDETRQGLRLNASYRLFKFVTWGANLSWRFQKSNMNVSKNLNTYVNISKVPFINTQLSLTANFLQTGYIDSRSYGVRISRDIVKGKLNGDVYFRMANYKYKTYEYSNQQKILGASLSYRLTRMLSLFVYYEGTFDNLGYDYNRFNTKIIQRF